MAFVIKVNLTKIDRNMLCPCRSQQNARRIAGCAVCMGCNSALVSVRHPPSHSEVQPLARYFTAGAIPPFLIRLHGMVLN
jgi:hypothetical protein